MSRHVISLLLPLVLACTHTAEPAPPEPPSQPLVIGKSPPAPIETLPDGPPKDAPVAAAPVTPLAIPARDPRLGRSQRAPALLKAETTALENLLAATSTSSPDRPAIALRLAESYAALGNHRDALAHYEMFTTTAAPHQARLDEGYYYAALESELLGDLRHARSRHYDLIKNFPNSRFIPLAYFAFGEIFFREAEQDPPKNDLAQQAYLEVMKYPAPANVVFADAHLRLSEVYARKGEDAKAKAMLAKYTTLTHP